MDSAGHAQQLLERGYTVFEDAFDRAWVEGLRAEILADYDAMGRPPLWSRDTKPLREDVVLCMAGLAVNGLLQRLPERARHLLDPQIINVFRRVLGEDMYMEVAGWVISDRRRPFFGWHVHTNGMDDGYHHARGFWPKIDGAQRLMAMLYLDDLDEERGQLLVHPRQVGTPIEPPHDPDLPNWAGQVEFGFGAGSMIAIEQCTWHAVRQQLCEGPRIWICCTFASGDAPRGGWFDERLLSYQSDEPRIRSVLPRKPPGQPPDQPPGQPPDQGA